MCSPLWLTFVSQVYESFFSIPMERKISLFHFSGISSEFIKDSLPIGLSLPHLGHLTMTPKGIASPTCTIIGNEHPQHLIHLTYLTSWCISILLNQGHYIYSDIYIVPYFVSLFKYLLSSMHFLPVFLCFHYIFFSFFFLISFFFELLFLILLYFL